MITQQWEGVCVCVRARVVLVHSCTEDKRAGMDDNCICGASAHSGRKPLDLTVGLSAKCSKSPD